MRRKFNLLILTSLSAVLLFSSCKKKLDEAYLNPNAPTKVPVENLFGALSSQLVSFYSTNGSAYGIAYDNIYVGRYIQYWGTNTATAVSTSSSINSNYDQMGGTVGGSDLLGSIWAMYYFGMGQNLNRVLTWGTEDQKWDFVGAAWALRAWGMLETTDQYNNMVLRDAFNSSLQQFTYQDQPEVYDSVRATCFRALSFLNRTDGNVNPTNFATADAYLNQGSIDKWKKFVYGVLARSYAYISNKPGYSADSVIKYASLSCSSNADNIIQNFAALGTSGTTNFYGPLRGNVGSLRQSAYIADLMTGNNPGIFTGVQDPRVGYLLRENTNDTYKGIIPWIGLSGLQPDDQPTNFWGATGTGAGPTPRYIFQDKSPFPVMTASEMQFLLAEAYLRKGDKANALTAYVNGISLNMDMLETVYSTNVSNTMTAASKAAYLSDPAVVPSSPAGLTLPMVMLQKYIALYGWGVQETWVDMRRYHYTDVDPVTGTGTQVYVGFTPPSGSSLYPGNKGKLVYRARMRYNSEYLYDLPSLLAIGAVSDLKGTQVTDYATLKPWFAQ